MSTSGTRASARPKRWKRILNNPYKMCRSTSTENSYNITACSSSQHEELSKLFLKQCFKAYICRK